MWAYGTHTGQLHATQRTFLAHQVTQGWTRPHVGGDGWETAHISEIGIAYSIIYCTPLVVVVVVVIVVVVVVVVVVVGAAAAAAAVVVVTM